MSGAEVKRRIVVDTDTGIDDALALLYLAAQPDVEIVAVTSIYGNCVIDDSLRNIAYVLGLVGITDLPVARGAAKPLNAEPHIAHYVHGYDGLGDVVDIDDRPMPTGLVDQTAAELLVELARAQPGELELLTLGPLTNIALALQAEPELLTLFRSITIMGGSGPFPEVGQSDMFDANIQNDADAANLVFSAPATRRVMVGVNITSGVVTDEQDVVALHKSGTPTGVFAAAILETYLDFYRLAWGRRISPVHDGLAAALMVHPEWITASVTGPANITHDGFTTRARIMQTAEGRAVPWAIEPAPDTIAVTGVDTAAFVTAFIHSLIHGSPSHASQGGTTA
ncbi:nucleoside hydrolase [Subtercola frigoramans]|uniref:Purine nucleosidase n=1 Tax=Subtercola frigoramans TaxID=120298 RepID=A0ABS2L7B9_9MICO|nr:nucleoside hydrolase [Subtercola frigoramans]MBM7472998.1 purine nucleosidase [Subtercola frigoramans]